MKESDKLRSLTSSNLRLDREEIEAQLHLLLGHFFVAFASVELNLSLRVGGEGTFRDKLERLLSSSIEFNDSEDAFCRTMAWYMAADSMREMRNRLAHGRWGYLVQLQRVVHVSGYPPGPQDERRFSLDELHAIVRGAESLNSELYGLAG